MKHWTEPNGYFIIKVPIEWQYYNGTRENCKEEPPYGFVPYDDKQGEAFQLSCYPLSEQGINPNFPIQKNNSKIKWTETRMDDNNFDVIVFYAQVDDLFCMAKYVYSSKKRNEKKIKEQIEKVKLSLDTFRVIPKKDREWAMKLDKHDNFLASLAASYDLLNNALKSDAYIEMVVILAGQIDAFLRSAIIIKEQLDKETDDIAIKYIYQADEENGIGERQIYKTAFEKNIIDKEYFDELNKLYNLRNRVIHRYIISYLKTKDIFRIAVQYLKLNEKIRLILKSYEEMQFGKGFGVYGKGDYQKNIKLDETDYRIAYSWANDKHLLKKFKREL